MLEDSGLKWETLLVAQKKFDLALGKEWPLELPWHLVRGSLALTLGKHPWG